MYEANNAGKYELFVLTRVMYFSVDFRSLLRGDDFASGGAALQ